MIYKVADPVADYNEYVEDCEAYASKFPKCSKCGEHIFPDEYYFVFDEKVYCADCAVRDDINEEEEAEKLYVGT